MSTDINCLPVPSSIFGDPNFAFSGCSYSHEGECNGYFCRNGCYKYFCHRCGRGTNRFIAPKCPTESCSEKIDVNQRQQS